jgi:ribosome maturation factor RimP
MAQAIDVIAEFLGPYLDEQDCYLVEVKHLPTNLVRVFIDSDSGLTIDKCAFINRKLRHFLEEDGLLGADFSIEVSSPGIGHPLKLTRQYVNNVGRFVKVLTTEGETVKGKLIEADEDRIVVEQTKKKESFQTELAFSEIDETVIQVKF